MLYKPFPICLSLSEVGKTVPAEIASFGYVDSEATIIPECVALGHVFDFPHRMLPVVRAEVPVTLLNLDVPPKQALPEYLPNGMLIYPQDRNLFHKLHKQLLEKYYHPFHQQLKTITDSGHIQLGLDCHLLPAQPRTKATGQSAQPLVCLSNNGNTLGEALSASKPLTCSSDMLRDVRDMVTARFADYPGCVTLNRPVSNGEIVSNQAGNVVPWIRIAIARELILDAEGALSEKRIEHLRDRFESILVMVCKLYEWL